MKPIFRTAQSEQNKRIFLNAGRQVLTTKTGSQLKIRDVVNESGLAPGSFYKYFPDKESFLIALMEEVVIPFRIMTQSARSSAKNGRDFVRNTMLVCMNLVRDTEQLNQLVIVNQHEFRKLFYMPHIFDPCVDEIIIDLEKGMESGMLRQHDAKEFTEVLLSLLLVLIVDTVTDAEYALGQVEFYVEFLAPYIDSPIEQA